MAIIVCMRQEKWIAPYLTRGTGNRGRMVPHNEVPKTRDRDNAAVKVGQVWYQKLHRVVYDDYLCRRYPMEIWVSVPEHVKA